MYLYLYPFSVVYAVISISMYCTICVPTAVPLHQDNRHPTGGSSRHCGVTQQWSQGNPEGSVTLQGSTVHLGVPFAYRHSLHKQVSRCALQVVFMFTSSHKISVKRMMMLLLHSQNTTAHKFVSVGRLMFYISAEMFLINRERRYLLISSKYLLN